MRILALETSCDDTACAIVADGRRILASVVASQNDAHQITGGVVPEVAAREHLQALQGVIQHTLAEANCTLDAIDAIAATLGPGLVGSLLVGVNAAKTLSWLSGKPFIPVHHLVGHVCANLLESDLSPPFVCLLVSGGHTQLMQVAEDFSMSVLGETLDDAVGEAYDKVGRVLGLGFPGGPVVDKLAQQGDASRFVLPIARTEQALDFSYSGLKTAVSRLWPKESDGLTGDALAQLRADVCASFQRAALRPLVTKTIAAAQTTGSTTVAVCGGVSANRGLRQHLTEACADAGLTLYLPHMNVCTDNAAMIASAAYFSPLLVSNPLATEVFSRGAGPLEAPVAARLV